MLSYVWETAKAEHPHTLFPILSSLVMQYSFIIPFIHFIINIHFLLLEDSGKVSLLLHPTPPPPIFVLFKKTVFSKLKTSVFIIIIIIKCFQKSQTEPHLGPGCTELLKFGKNSYKKFIFRKAVINKELRPKHTLNIVNKQLTSTVQPK